MPHTASWDETKPAGSDFASSIDNQMRDMKRDIRERMAVCFVWGVDTTNDGKMVAVTLAPVNDTSAIATSTPNSVTGSGASNMVDLAQTWNTSGAPTAVKVNITNTASGAAAKLMDLQVSGSSKFAVDKAGNVTCVGIAASAAVLGPNGTSGAPSFAFSSAPTIGVYKDGTRVGVAGGLSVGGVALVDDLGVVSMAALGSGTPDSTKFLRGDGSWQVPTSGPTWTAVSFNAGDFTANVGSWTVASGDVTTLSYLLSGKVMTVSFVITTTDISGGPANYLKIKIPAAATAAKKMTTVGYCVEAGTPQESYITVEAGETVIRIYTLFGAGFSNTTGNTGVEGQITFEIQ